MLSIKLYTNVSTQTLAMKYIGPGLFGGFENKGGASDLPSLLYILRSIVRDLTPEPLAELNSDSGIYPAAITADLGASVYLTVFAVVA